LIRFGNRAVGLFGYWTRTGLRSRSGDAGIAGALTGRLHRINPAAPILPVALGDVSAPFLLNLGFYNPATESVDVRRWLDAEAYGADEHQHENDGTMDTKGR
jgi:hypothetical protein